MQITKVCEIYLFKYCILRNSLVLEYVAKLRTYIPIGNICHKHSYAFIVTLICLLNFEFVLLRLKYN